MKTIIYNKYAYKSGKSIFLYEREYTPTDQEDYDRVMKIFETQPDEYELVNEY